MNYRDLQNISNLSQEILIEGAKKEHNVLNRWPYTSPYLQESTELDEATLSTKAARAGKDIGEPGKNFSKIEKTAAKRYGSKEAGKRVAGAVLAKMRANEQVDLYDIILSHLLDEGYAETQEQAEVIMVNMSEDWRESICEGKREFPHKKVDRQVYDAMDSGETAGDSGNAAKEKRDYGRADKMRSVAAKHGGKTRG